MKPYRDVPDHLQAGPAPLSAARNIRTPWWRRIRVLLWSRTGTGKRCSLAERLAEQGIRRSANRVRRWLDTVCAIDDARCERIKQAASKATGERTII